MHPGIVKIQHLLQYLLYLALDLELPIGQGLIDQVIADHLPQEASAAACTVRPTLRTLNR